MTNPPESTQPDPSQPSESRLDRIEAMQERAQLEMAGLRQIIEAEAIQRSLDRAADREDMSNLRKLIDSNAKAIEAQGNQSAADRDLARADRELNRQSRDETREDIRQLAALMREDRERSLTLEREIRMQSGEIQNLADSIQVLYSRQPPSS